MGLFLVLFIFIPIINLITSSTVGEIIANLQDSQVIESIFVSVYGSICNNNSHLIWCTISIHPREDMISKEKGL